jgi:hypothetical protein
MLREGRMYWGRESAPACFKNANACFILVVLKYGDDDDD